LVRHGAARFWYNLKKGDRLEDKIDTNLLGKKVWILLQGGYHRIGDSQSAAVQGKGGKEK